jgi:integrase
MTRRSRRGWGKIRRLPSKRYQASYSHQASRHVAPVTFTNKMDAEHWLSDERRLIEQDRWTPPAMRKAANAERGTTFGEYATGWLETRNLKLRSGQQSSDLINGRLTKLHNVPLSQLTAEVVRVWWAGLDASTPTRNSHAYQTLRSVLNTAVSDGLMTASPCTIRGAGTTRPKRKPVILTPEEVAKVALAVPPELKALTLISAWCGLRIGEVAALTLADVSDDCTVIEVNRDVAHRGGCLIDTPKNGEVRAVPVPPHIVPDIRDHLTNHVGAAPDSVLFKPAKTCHYTESTFGRVFKRALKSAGISKTPVVHDLRHFMGTYTAQVANMVEVQQRLGHRSARASLMYTQVADDRGRQVAEELSRLAGWQG